MSYREHLLTQPGPLEPHERIVLEEWLAVFQADCARFGETPEDTALMERIRTKLKEDGHE
jgi:hypothetical protein